MAAFGFFFLFFLCIAMAAANSADREHKQSKSKALAQMIVDSLNDYSFNKEIVFDLKKENQIYVNRTTSLIIKYIVKREVDNYRPRRTEAISRRIYSTLVMKLIDIAKDLPKNASSKERIGQAHEYYTAVVTKDTHDDMADRQVFHQIARLYDIMFTTPRILAHLGRTQDLTAKRLVKKLAILTVKPVHLAVALVIQYHLRNTVNFAIRHKAVDVLSTKPSKLDHSVIKMLEALAIRLLPVSELLDIHLANYSPAFRDRCPKTWLGIVNNKKP